MQEALTLRHLALEFEHTLPDPLVRIEILSVDRKWMGRVGTNTILVEFKNKLNKNKLHVSLKNSNYRRFHKCE